MWGRNVLFTAVQSEDSLHIKASQGDLAGVKQLLDTGIDVNQTDEQGCTALHWAADRGADQACLRHTVPHC